MRETEELEINLPYPVFDSHFHALHMANKGLDIENLIPRLFVSGLSGAMEVAVDEHHFEKRRLIAQNYPDIRISAGIHPSSTAAENGKWQDRFDVIRRQVENPQVTAIGETGLDFFRDVAPPIMQEQAFRDHLDLAVETDLPVIIHNRSADSRVLGILKESKCRRGVFHCFSSGAETAKRALDLGFHISFAGNITYKKSDALREAAALVPSDRLLVETDSPYLSPQAVRGRPNHPGHLGFTLKRLAEIRGDDIGDLAAETRENARELFGGNKN